MTTLVRKCAVCDHRESFNGKKHEKGNSGVNRSYVEVLGT